MAQSTDTHERLTDLTAEIIAAYVSNNTIEADELGSLMATVYSGLASLGQNGLAKRPAPACDPKKSVTDAYIICLEDGKKLKMLKRHLKTAYKMTPDQYRDRWSLGADYPMVAPNYAKQRSRLAKQIGLGTSRRKAA
jgi:predicted transcriptional regulator